MTEASRPPRRPARSRHAERIRGTRRPSGACPSPRSSPNVRWSTLELTPRKTPPRGRRCSPENQCARPRRHAQPARRAIQRSRRICAAMSMQPCASDLSSRGDEEDDVLRRHGMRSTKLARGTAPSPPPPHPPPSRHGRRMRGADRRRPHLVKAEPPARRRRQPRPRRTDGPRTTSAPKDASPLDSPPSCSDRAGAAL